MSCSNRNLRDVDTTVYRASNGCCSGDDGVTIQFIDRASPCCQYPPVYPLFPFPLVNPPVPPVVPAVVPTTLFALFANEATAGATYTAGALIPYPTTVLNTDTAGIINNGAGTLTLTGGTTGRTYLVNYQVSGTVTDATVGLAVNGVNAVSSNSTVAGTAVAGTLKGSYVLTVPANTTATVSLNVISGTVVTAAPTTGTNISVVRIA